MIRKPKYIFISLLVVVLIAALFFTTSCEVLELVIEAVGIGGAKTIEEANRLGLNIIDATINQMEEASARGGPLSMEDKLTFIIARDNRQVCWTSDKNLRNKCLENGVSVYWGLEILLILCREGRLTVQRALKTAEKIKECGAHISKEVLDDFRNQVDEIFSSE